MSAPRTAPARAPLHAFEACGVEIEYVLVDAASLDVAPCADTVLRELAGAAAPVNTARRGMFAWSNELALHVLEVKNDEPTIPMDLLAGRFEFEVQEANALLAARGLRLMPSGMHPWMDPGRETRLWRHTDAHIYSAYHRIFDCHTHGYANVQSMHVNLPFADDREFFRLHEAIRWALPILPALAASSPYVEGRAAAHRDHRLVVYRTNAARIPEITGDVVPERCTDRSRYETDILRPMYAAIAPHDPAGVLQHEWLNARGAIARFDRHAIEIRILDTQECPRMDIGIAALVVDLLQARYEGRFPGAAVPVPATDRLAQVLEACMRDAESARIEEREFLDAYGMGRASCRAGDLWEHIGATLAAMGSPRLALWRACLDRILLRGTLASRLRARAGSAPSRRRLHATYQTLCEALAANHPID